MARDVQWRDITWAQCDACGHDVQVYTDCAPAEVQTDDYARCTHCGGIGIVNVCDDGLPWICWRGDG